MREIDRNSGRSRGGTFGKHNPGKKPGAHHTAMLARLALIDGEDEALIRKAIDMALAGDITALRLCPQRLAPPLKVSPTRFDLRLIEGAGSTPAAMRPAPASSAHR